MRPCYLRTAAEQQRAHWLCNTLDLVQRTRGGKQLVLSCGAIQPQAVKPPFDLINV